MHFWKVIKLLQSHKVEKPKLCPEHSGVVFNYLFQWITNVLALILEHTHLPLRRLRTIVTMYSIDAASLRLRQARVTVAGECLIFTHFVIRRVGQISILRHNLNLDKQYDATIFSMKLLFLLSNQDLSSWKKDLSSEGEVVIQSSKVLAIIKGLLLPLNLSAVRVGLHSTMRLKAFLQKLDCWRLPNFVFGIGTA